MTDLLLRNARLLDVATGAYAEADLRCADGRIVETGARLTAPDTRELDLGGAVVIPGLIDAHVHVTALTADLGSLGPTSPPTPPASWAGCWSAASPPCATSRAPITAWLPRRPRA